jgi:hypothetical protein
MCGSQEPNGSLLEGPNTYRAASLVLLSPVYASVLCVVGTAAGRHAYFAGMATKIWGRFLLSSARQRLLHSTPQAKVQSSMLSLAATAAVAAAIPNSDSQT